MAEEKKAPEEKKIDIALEYNTSLKMINSGLQQITQLVSMLAGELEKLNAPEENKD